jgi:hypothetical protein
MRGTQQQNFLCENQHVWPSPLLLSTVFAHPSGHELPIKQNGATPYHLHKASTEYGTIVTSRRNKIVVFNINEAIMTIIISTIKRNNISNKPHTV